MFADDIDFALVQFRVLNLGLAPGAELVRALALPYLPSQHFWLGHKRSHPKEAGSALLLSCT